MKFDINTFRTAYATLAAANIICGRINYKSEILFNARRTGDAKIIAAAEYVCEFGDF